VSEEIDKKRNLEVKPEIVAGKQISFNNAIFESKWGSFLPKLPLFLASAK
jgi:hypothetical protein